MEGSISRGEPSTLYARIVDGSRSKGRTIHAGSRYYGRFMSQKRTFHAVCPNRGQFEVKMVNHPRWRLISWKVQYLGANLPCWRAESWTVQGQKGEPSTPVVDIMDGSYIKHEPPHRAPLSRRSLRRRHQPPRGGMRSVGLRRWCARSALPRNGGRGEIKEEWLASPDASHSQF